MLDSAVGGVQLARWAFPSRVTMPAARGVARVCVSSPVVQLSATQRIVCECNRVKALARRAVRGAPQAVPAPAISHSHEGRCEVMRQSALVCRWAPIGAMAVSVSQVDRLLEATEK